MANCLFPSSFSSSFPPAAATTTTTTGSQSTTIQLLQSNRGTPIRMKT